MRSVERVSGAGRWYRWFSDRGVGVLGGALAYANAISVTPGASFTAAVGAGGGDGGAGAVRIIWVRRENFRRLKAYGELVESVSSSLDDFVAEHVDPSQARNRQQLLATMVLMGINRIVVTDGNINARLQFDFGACLGQQPAPV